MVSNTSSQDEKHAVDVALEEVNPVLSTVVNTNNESIQIRAKDADDAIKFLGDIKDFDLDPAYEKKLVRKIDWMILPVLAFASAIQLMDKSSNGYAAVMNLRTDLKMSSSEYSWVGSAFYVGYLVFEPLASYLLQHFPISKVLSIAIICWGVVITCHAACNNAESFLTCRTLLGAFEGFMNPSFVLLTSMWWRPSESLPRVSIWWGCQGLGTILGSGIAYGLVVNRTGKHALASWRLLFIIIGIITIALGIVTLFHLPDSPAKAWFLNDKDKKYCVARARDNQQGFGNHKFKKYQFIEAFKDINTWFLFIYAMSFSIPNGGFNNFGTILLHGDFGFSTADAILMNMPGAGIDILFPPLVAYFNKKVMKGRCLVSCVAVNCICIAGMCCLNFTKHKGSKLFGYLSFYMCCAASSGAFSIISANFAGYTKKATFNAIYLIAYAAGNIIGPQTFIGTQAPGYVGAKTAMLVSFIAGTICLAGMLWDYTKRNHERDSRGDKVVEDKDATAFADMTDWENPNFRYKL